MELQSEECMMVVVLLDDAIWLVTGRNVGSVVGSIVGRIVGSVAGSAVERIVGSLTVWIDDGFLVGTIYKTIAIAHII